MGETPFYPIGASGWRGWLFRQIFGKNYLGAFSQSTFMLNRGVPILVDMENLMGVYLMVPHLRAVIDRRAEMFANADVYVVNAEGERVESHPIETLLRNPNPLQTQEQYMYQWAIYEGIYSQCFEYKLKLLAGFRPGPKCLWNLPPSNMRVIPTGKVWEQTTIEGIIEKYVMMNAESGTMERTFETKDIILTTTGVSNQYIVGSSRLLTLEKPLNNLVGSLRTRGAILFDRGALGILSSASKDSTGGGIPLDQKEKQRIEKQYPADYGIQDGQIRTLVTNAALTYTSMTFPTKDLMLDESDEGNFQCILSSYSMARDLFPSTKGATFENQEQAVKQTYQNAIQPLADSYCRSREQDPDIKPLLKAGEKLRASYNHLPVMKEDELAKAQTYEILQRTGAATSKVIAEEFDIAYEVPDKSELQEEAARKGQLELRSTVGGNTGLIAINQAVTTGQMDREVGVSILVNNYGYEKSIAESMVSTYKKPDPPKPTPIP